MYFFIEIPVSYNISAVWSVIQSPERLIIAEINDNFNGEETDEIESIIQPFDISQRPHISDVNMSFLNGENAVMSSHITEKNTIYTLIFTIDDAVSLTEAVNALLFTVLSNNVIEKVHGALFLNSSA